MAPEKDMKYLISGIKSMIASNPNPSAITTANVASARPCATCNPALHPPLIPCNTPIVVIGPGDIITTADNSSTSTRKPIKSCKNWLSE